MGDNRNAAFGESAFLEVVTARAQSDRGYLAWAISTYAQLEGIPANDIVARLGVSPSDYHDFMLSARPLGLGFRDKVNAISHRFRIDTAGLAGVLRHVEATEVMSSAGPTSADAGVLMAARMRDHLGRAALAPLDEERGEGEVSNRKSHKGAPGGAGDES